MNGLPLRCLLAGLGLLLVTGCGEQRQTPADVPAELVGVWLAPSEGVPGAEGYQFESDGSLRLVNMLTAIGTGWEMVGTDTLRIWSATERHAEPEADDLVVASVTATRLKLRWAGQADGVEMTYQRQSDPWLGRWTGADGGFVDITPLAGSLRVVIKSRAGLRADEGRLAGADVVVGGQGAERRLVHTGQGCIQLDGDEKFCRRLRAE